MSTTENGTDPIRLDLAMAEYERWADDLPADQIAAEVHRLANSVREHLAANPQQIEQTFQVGDTVRLTGQSWPEFGLANREVVVGYVNTFGEAEFKSPEGAFVIFLSGEDDYSATLVKAVAA